VSSHIRNIRGKLALALLAMLTLALMAFPATPVLTARIFPPK
jgi:hypothetical protein